MADEMAVYANEAEATRDRIADTIDELQDRLDPRNMVREATTPVREAMSAVTDAGTEFLTSAREIVRGNPVVLGAAVVAIGLLALGGSRGLGGAKVDLEGYGNGYTDYDDDYSPGRSGVYDSDGYSATDGIGNRARQQFSANPIVGIVAGLAVGALLGALFPATAAENRVLGQSRERLSAAARAAARTAKQQLDERGLSVENVKAQAQKVVDEAKAAASNVVSAAKDELRTPVATEAPASAI